MQEKLYELTLDLLKNQGYFNAIAKNEKINYYWSEDWSEEFYIKQAQLGFISTTYESYDKIVLLPELQFEYGVLEFQNLHISSKVKKLIKEDRFQLTFNTCFEKTMEQIAKQHHYNWLKEPYITLLKQLYNKQNSKQKFSLHSIELIAKEESNKLIAGEIGYVIGSAYTSLTGFSLREKRYNNCGKLQLVYLGEHLKKQGFTFWNLGHPHMAYKKHLGIDIYSRKDFLPKWQEATNQKQKDLYE